MANSHYSHQLCLLSRSGHKEKGLQTWNWLSRTWYMAKPCHCLHFGSLRGFFACCCFKADMHMHTPSEDNNCNETKPHKGPSPLYFALLDPRKPRSTIVGRWPADIQRTEPQKVPFIRNLQVPHSMRRYHLKIVFSLLPQRRLHYSSQESSAPQKSQLYKIPHYACLIRQRHW